MKLTGDESFCDPNLAPLGRKRYCVKRVILRNRKSKRDTLQLKTENFYQRLDPHLGEYLKGLEQPRSEWDLFDMSLHVARVGDTDLRREECLSQVTHIRNKVERTLNSSDPYSIIEHTNEIVFQKLGYCGNREDYYHPCNSLMDRVLEQRTGIPITLSVLYREVVGGLGLPTWGVGLPGHFLLGFRASSRELYLDAFNGGRILLPDDCRALLNDLFGDEVAFETYFLNPLPDSAIVLRMLMNLKQIYRRRAESVSFLRVLNRRIPLLADPLSEILERGMTLVELEEYRAALDDFRTFIENTSDHSLRKVVEGRIERLELLAGEG